MSDVTRRSMLRALAVAPAAALFTWTEAEAASASRLGRAAVSAASQAVAIPTGVQFFCFLATLLVGRVVASVPILFVIGGLATFVLGGLTGVMIAMAPFNFQAHDTFFIVGHLHTVLIGGTVFPIFAGLYYFFPLATARKLSDRLGRVAFWLMLVGFNVI